MKSNLDHTHRFLLSLPPHTQPSSSSPHFTPSNQHTPSFHTYPIHTHTTTLREWDVVLRGEGGGGQSPHSPLLPLYCLKWEQDRAMTLQQLSPPLHVDHSWPPPSFLWQRNVPERRCLENRESSLHCSVLQIPCGRWQDP